MPYSTSNIIIDVLLIACFFTIDLGRISVAQSGNKTGKNMESSVLTLIFQHFVAQSEFR